MLRKASNLIGSEDTNINCISDFSCCMGGCVPNPQYNLLYWGFDTPNTTSCIGVQFNEFGTPNTTSCIGGLEIVVSIDNKIVTQSFFRLKPSVNTMISLFGEYLLVLVQKPLRNW